MDCIYEALYWSCWPLNMLSHLTSHSCMHTYIHSALVVYADLHSSVESTVIHWWTLQRQTKHWIDLKKRSTYKRQPKNPTELEAFMPEKWGKISQRSTESPFAGCQKCLWADWQLAKGGLRCTDCTGNPNFDFVLISLSFFLSIQLAMSTYSHTN